MSEPIDWAEIPIHWDEVNQPQGANSVILAHKFWYIVAILAQM